AKKLDSLRAARAGPLWASEKTCQTIVVHLGVDAEDGNEKGGRRRHAEPPRCRSPQGSPEPLGPAESVVLQISVPSYRVRTPRSSGSPVARSGMDRDKMRQPSRRLSFDEAVEIHRRLRRGEFVNRIAAHFDVNPGRVSE